jgi:hypothetical protein
MTVKLAPHPISICDMILQLAIAVAIARLVWKLVAVPHEPSGAIVSTVQSSFATAGFDTSDVASATAREVTLRAKYERRIAMLPWFIPQAARSDRTGRRP